MIAQLAMPYTTPGINKDWPKHAGDLNDEFVQFVESCVD